MRNRIRGDSDKRVAGVIADNYELLLVRCGRAFRRGPFQLEDVVHETFLFVSTDPAAQAIPDKKALLDYFVYRFRMIAFQIMKDHRKMLRYADDKKTKKTDEEY